MFFEDIFTDMDTCNLSFKHSFGLLRHKFHSENNEYLHSLFNSCCSSFYGYEHWVNQINCSRNFQVLLVSYYSAFKKILCILFIGFSIQYSNHLNC